MTVLEKLVESLRSAAIYNRHDLAPPSVVLWTDGAEVWAKAVPLVRDAMPELLILDADCDGERQGPSTWLRYQLARRDWHKTPVLYLPGVARQAFRGAAGFPDAARHLFALQYQGQFWTQANGKDWTPSAFLSSDVGGLGLDVARDRATLNALAAQLTQVLRTPLTGLSGRRLEAADFHALAAADPVGLMLEWMAQPVVAIDSGSSGSKPLSPHPNPLPGGEGTSAAHDSWPAERWVAFTALCRQTFGLDPDKDGALLAAEKLVAGGGIWDQVWKRYCDAPKAYAGLRKVLDWVQPKDLFDHNERIPATNRHEEDSLRKALAELAQLPKHQALKKLASLCCQHAPRAKSIWADLGEAPLALASVHLHVLADGIAAGNLGNDWHELAEAYTQKGWAIDAAAWKAYAEVRDAADVDAVAVALRAAYLPWLEGLAGQVQAWIELGCPQPSHLTGGEGNFIDTAVHSGVEKIPPTPLFQRGVELTGRMPETVAARPYSGLHPTLNSTALGGEGGYSYPMAAPGLSPVLNPMPGTVLVFVDGLRCDLGLELQAMFSSHGFGVLFETRWSALPTVTATAKPAWKPLAEGLTGDCLGEGFEPQIAGTGQTLSTQSFRKKLVEYGWSWLDVGATGDPSGAAWTEIGSFDHDGHALGARLAWRISDELNAVFYRVRELLNAGWKQATLITDHGWLWLPKGLPKVDLPGHLTLSRWPRCAIPQAGAQHGFKETPWFWGGGHTVVCAPGISAFKSGIEYAHGGLSLQEALIPHITVSLGAQQAEAPVEIESVKWAGLRLKVQLQGVFQDILLDIRTKPADPASSLLALGKRLKPPEHDGTASLLVASEDYEGVAAMLVAVRNGQVVAKRTITIGED